MHIIVALFSVLFLEWLTLVRDIKVRAGTARGAPVGRLGKLRPIVNRPTAAFAPDSGGRLPPGKTIGRLIDNRRAGCHPAPHSGKPQTVRRFSESRRRTHGRQAD
jgi:hypothetical protein